VAQSGTDVPTLRADTLKHGPALERAARKMFGEWLDRFEPAK
jgi:GMP synthase (glutamine-hydrolysing)